MIDNVIQLNQPPFWVACVVGIVLTAVFGGATQRKWCLALVNLSFVAAILRAGAVGVFGGILVVYAALRIVERGPSAKPAITLIGATLLALFVLHKLPNLAGSFGLSPLARVLSLIGYSYVALRAVEVFRAVSERRHAAPDLPSLVNYLVPFHMLAAGPIQAYDDYVNQPLRSRPATTAEVLAGTERVASGLFKKFVIAYLLQKLFLTDFQAGGSYRLLEIQVFFVWLFLDFSAYSDIAVGVGSFLGLVTPENFNRPLGARNVIDFWERWHISLSMFIRRNLFTPIQLHLLRRDGGRRPLLWASVALCVSFVLCGLWHGLTMGFLIWGMAQAVALVIVRVYSQFLQKRLGRQGVKRYLANPLIRAAACVVTFEFQAVTFLALFLRV